MDIEYTVETTKSPEAAAADVQAISQEKGFRVLAVHDISATLAAKGFDLPPTWIIEVCNAKHAHAVLTVDPRVALMLPCPISVYARDGKTYISTMLPTMISAMYPESDFGSVPMEVETVLKEIVDAAR